MERAKLKGDLRLFGILAFLIVGTTATVVVACEPPEKKPAPEVAEEIIEAGVSYRYLDDGSRLTEYTQEGYADVLSICDGSYLVDQTEFMGGTSNAITRTEAPDICADGKLTPEDFEFSG